MPKIKFKGTPGMLVKSHATGTPLFRFNKKGEYTTDDSLNKKIIERLKKRFPWQTQNIKGEWVSPPQDVPDKPDAETPADDSGKDTPPAGDSGKNTTPEGQSAGEDKA